MKPYFLDCDIREYNVYDLAPAPCTDCKYCEYHDGCSNKDLDIFFEDFEEADFIAFFTPVYNNFFPAPLKAVIDRFQRYYSARFKRGANPPVKTLKQAFEVLNGDVCARYFIPNTDLGMYTFNVVELQKFIHQLKGLSKNPLL